MRKHLGLTLILATILALTACGKFTNSKKIKDRIEVYDKNEEMILEMVDKEDLNYFSELVGKTTQNMENEDFPLVKLPEDAVVSYKYRFIRKKENGKESAVDFDVYENYQYITLKHFPFKKITKEIPILTSLTWKLSDKEYEKLNNPEK